MTGSPTADRTAWKTSASTSTRCASVWRTFARPCPDWTERRPHLAGALGAGIAECLLELDWRHRVPGTRALRVTGTGHKGLREQLGVNLRSN